MAAETQKRRDDLNYGSLVEQLDRRKAELEQEIDRLKLDEQESDGALSHYDQHDADQATDTFLRERDLALIDSMRHELHHVVEARERIESGSYGYCSACSKPIPLDRLEAMPFADMCVECAEERAGLL